MGRLKKQSVMSIITAKATPNFSFFIKLGEAIMKGSGYIKRVFEVVERSDPSEGHGGIPQYEDQLGYAIGRDAIISVLPDCVGQDGFRSISGQIETWNVFFLPTAAILTRFGKSIRLSAGWWGSY